MPLQPASEPAVRDNARELPRCLVPNTGFQSIKCGFTSTLPKPCPRDRKGGGPRSTERPGLISSRIPLWNFISYVSLRARTLTPRGRAVCSGSHSRQFKNHDFVNNPNPVFFVYVSLPDGEAARGRGDSWRTAKGAGRVWGRASPPLAPTPARGRRGARARLGEPRRPPRPAPERRAPGGREASARERGGEPGAAGRGAGRGTGWRHAATGEARRPSRAGPAPANLQRRLGLGRRSGAVARGARGLGGGAARTWPAPYRGLPPVAITPAGRPSAPARRV
ncbi:collagen alpha-1(I) chain-like [Bos javanicus]|uniref:collagen alpha-1(I) chain-like n=1 Tax=Bos javanicus TaxID=9906 RepID=UPI002AA8BCC6|nr:collagen alpha-1(I) chain-like [Bos javanicus]